MSGKPVDPAAIAVYNAALDAALDHRITLHHLRQSGDLEVKSYLAGLKAVREIERALEPLRGQPSSRAFELSRAEIERELAEAAA